MPLHRITRLVVAGIASAAIVATPVGAIAAASAQPLPTGVGVPWATTMPGSGGDWSTAIANGDDGASVVVGNLGSATAAFGGTTLTRAGTSGTDAFVTNITERGAFAWAVRGGGTGADEATGVATRGDGSSVVVGKFVGSAGFGATTLTGGGGSTGWDVFIAGLTPAGAFSWATAGTVGASGQKAGARSVATLPDGSAIVVGEFNGTLTLGGTTLATTGGWDVFIARVMDDGTVAWALPGGSPTGDDGAYGVARLPDGDVVVTGLFTGTMTLGGRTLTGAGDKDAWVARVTPRGAVEWATSAGGTGIDWGMGIAAAPDGSSVMTGFFTSNPATFGSTTLATAGGNDIFVAKVTAAGRFAWAIRGGGTGTDRGQAVATQADGSATVTGYYSGQGGATLGTTPLPGTDANTVLVARVGPTGTVSWATGAGGAGTDRGTGVASSSTASSTVVGFFAQSIGFGGVTLTSGSGTNPFIANYRTPCASDVAQLDRRTVAYDPSRRAYRVTATVTVMRTPASACQVRTTVMLRDASTGRRLMLMPGSVVGTTTLRAASSAPTTPWPGGEGRDLTLRAEIARGPGVTPSVLRRAQLVLVRRIPTDPLQPVSAGNPRVAQSDIFGSAPGWSAG